MPVDLDTFNYAAYLDAIGVQGFNAEELNDAQKRILYNHATQKAYDVFSKELRQNDPFTSREEIKKEAVRQSLELFPSGRSAFNLPEERTTEEAFSMDEFRDFLASRPLQSEDISRDLKEFAKTRIHKTTEWQYPDLKDASKEDFVQLFMEHNNIDEFVTRSDILGSSQDPSLSSEGGPPRGGYKTGLLPALRQGVYNLGTSFFSTGTAIGEWINWEGLANVSKDIVSWFEEGEEEYGYRPTYGEQTWGESIRGGLGIVPFMGDFYSKLFETAAENWGSVGLNLALLALTIPSGGTTGVAAVGANAGKAAKLTNMVKRAWDMKRQIVGFGGSALVSTQEIGAMRHELEKQGFYNPENDAARVMAFGTVASLLDMAGAAGGLGRHVVKQSGVLRDLFKKNIPMEKAQQLLQMREGILGVAHAMGMQAGTRPFRRFMTSKLGSTLKTAGIEMGTEALQENLAFDVALYKDLSSAISDIWKPGTHHDFPDRFKEGERFERTVGAALVGGLLGGGTHYLTYPIVKYSAEREARRQNDERRASNNEAFRNYVRSGDEAVDPYVNGGLIPDFSTDIPGVQIFSTPDNNTLVAQYAGKVVEVHYDPEIDGEVNNEEQKSKILQRRLVREMIKRHNEDSARSNIDENTSITTDNNGSVIKFKGRDQTDKVVRIEGDKTATIARSLVREHNDKGKILTLDTSIEITKESLGGEEVTLDNARNFVIDTNNTYRGNRGSIQTTQGDYLDIPLDIGHAITFQKDENTPGDAPTYAGIAQTIEDKGFTILGEIEPNRMFLYKDGYFYKVDIKPKGNRNAAGYKYSVEITDVITGEKLPSKVRDIREEAAGAGSTTGAGTVISRSIRVAPPFEGVRLMTAETDPSGAQISDESFGKFAERLGATVVNWEGSTRGSSLYIKRMKFGEEQGGREVTFMLLKDKRGKLTIFAHNGNRALTNFENINDLDALGDDKLSGDIEARARQNEGQSGFVLGNRLHQNATSLGYHVFSYNAKDNVGLNPNKTFYILQFSYGDENGNNRSVYWVVEHGRGKRQTVKWTKLSFDKAPYWERILNVQQATTVEDIQKSFGNQLLKTYVYVVRNSQTGNIDGYFHSKSKNDEPVTVYDIKRAFYSNTPENFSGYEILEVYMLRHPEKEDAVFVIPVSEVEEYTGDESQNPLVLKGKEYAMAISPDSSFTPLSVRDTSIFDYIRRNASTSEQTGEGVGSPGETAAINAVANDIGNIVESAESNILQENGDTQPLTDTVSVMYPDDTHKDRLIQDIKGLQANVEATKKARDRWGEENQEDGLLQSIFETTLERSLSDFPELSRNLSLEELQNIYRANLLDYYLRSIEFLYSTSSGLLSSEIRNELSRQITTLESNIRQSLNQSTPLVSIVNENFNNLRVYLKGLEERITGTLKRSKVTLSDFFDRNGQNGYYSVANRIRPIRRRDGRFSLQHPLRPTGEEPIRRHNKATLFQELVLDGRVSDSVLADLISSEAIRVLNNQEEAIDTIQQLENNGEDIEAYYEEGLISGFVASDGRIYLVADGIFEGRATGVYMHELGVHFKRLGMSDPDFQLVCSEVSRRVGDIIRENVSESERGSEANALMRAYEMAKAGGLNENNQGFWEEVVAYFVQENIDLGIGIAGRINSSFKRAALRLGVIDASKLTNKDIVNFAIGASRNASRFDFDIRYEDNGVNDDLIYFLTGTFPIHITRGVSGVDQEREETQSTPPKLSFISPEAAQRLDAATGATYRLMALDVAREMERAGKSPEAIKFVTNWHRNDYGEWSYELTDENAKFIFENAEKAKQMEAELNLLRLSQPNSSEALSLAAKMPVLMRVRNKPLSEVLHHPELFSAYPHLRDLMIDIKEGNPNGYNSNPEQIRLDSNLPPSQLLNILMHEVQHSIQNREGHDEVTNSKIFEVPEYFERVKKAEFERKTSLDALRNFLDFVFTDEIISRISENEDSIVITNPFGNDSDFGDFLGQIGRDSIYGYITDYSSSFRDQFSSYVDVLSEYYDLNVIQQRYEELVGNWKKTLENYNEVKKEPYKKYLESIKEMESRVVQLRQDMTEEERRLSPISESQELIREAGSYESIVNARSLLGLNDPNKLKKIIYGLGQQQQQSEVVENQNKKDRQTKFSFISKEAAQRLDAATGTTYRVNNLLIAIEMFNNGISPDLIKLATNWHKGKDGHWKYEIVGTNANFNLTESQFADIKKSEERFAPAGERLKYKKPLNGTLGDLFNYPELFIAYPQLKNLPVEFTSMWPAEFGVLETIGEGKEETLVKIKLNGFKELELNRITLLHEIQHAIQILSGFGRGGTIRKFTQVEEKEILELTKKVEIQKEAIRSFISNFITEDILEKALTIRFEKIGSESEEDLKWREVSQLLKTLDLFDDPKKINSFSDVFWSFRIDSLMDYYTNEEIYNFIRALKGIHDRFVDNFRELKSKQEVPFNEYLDLLGELESRTVQLRDGMTDQERLLNSLATSEEIIRRIAGPDSIIEARKDSNFIKPEDSEALLLAGEAFRRLYREELIARNNDGNQTKFSFVKDPNILRQLRREPSNLRPPEGEKPIRLFRALQRDEKGNLYPVMGKTFKRKGSSQITGEVIVGRHIGSWTQADVRGDVVSHWAYSEDEGKEVPYVILGKGGGTPIPARFNPYIHVSDTPLNDQFTSAWKRPEIVIAEVEIPWYVIEPGERTPYIAQAKTPDGRIAVAKDPEGKTNWKSGPVNSQFPEDLQRTVYISQYARIVNILTPENIADEINRKLEQSKNMGKEIRLPVNVVSPEVRAVLEDKHKVRLVPPMGIQGNWETEAPTDKDGRVIPLRKLHPLSSEEPPGLRTKFSMTSDPNRRNPNGRREVAGAPGVFRTRNNDLQIDESRLPKGREAETIAYGAVRSSEPAQRNPDINNLIAYLRGNNITQDVLTQYLSFSHQQREEALEVDERLTFALAARWILSNPAQTSAMSYSDGGSLYGATARILADSLKIAFGTDSLTLTDNVLASVANALGGLENTPLHGGLPTPIDTSSFERRFDEMSIYGEVRNLLSLHDDTDFIEDSNGNIIVEGKEDGINYRLIGADRNVEGNAEARKAAFRTAADRVLQNGIVNHMQLETFFTEDESLPVFLQTGNEYGALGEIAQREDVENFMSILPRHLQERIVVHYEPTTYAKGFLQGALGIFYPFARGKKMIHVRGWGRTLGQVVATIAHEASHFGWLMWGSQGFNSSIGKIYDKNPGAIYDKLKPYFQALGITRESAEYVPLEIKVYMVNELYAAVNESVYFEEGNQVAEILGLSPEDYAKLRNEVMKSIEDIKTNLIGSIPNLSEETREAFAQDILKMTIGSSVGRGVNAFYETESFDDPSGQRVPGERVNIFVNDYGQRRIQGTATPLSEQVKETKKVIEYWSKKGKWGKAFATFVLNNFPMRNGLSFLHLNVRSAALGEQIGTARANVLMGQVWRKVSEEMAGELRDRYDIYTDLEAAMINVGYDPSLVTGRADATFEETIRKLGLDSRKRLLQKAKDADEAVTWAREQLIKGAFNIREHIKIQADNLAARMRVAFAQNPEMGERVIGHMYSKMAEFAEKFNGDWQHRMYRAFEPEGQMDLRAMLYYLEVNPNTGGLRLKEEQDIAETEMRNLQELLNEGAITPFEYRKAAVPHQRIIKIAQRLDALETYVKMRMRSNRIASLRNNYSAYVVNAMRAEIQEVLSHSEKLNSGIVGDDHLNTISAVMQRELDERYELHRKYMEFLDPETNILKVLLHSVDQQNKILTKLDYNAELGEHILDSGMGVFRGLEIGERMSSKIGYLEEGSFLQFIAIDPIFQEALEKEYNIQKDLRESMLGDIVSAWRANNTIYSLKLGMSNYIGNIGLLVAGGHLFRWGNMAVGGGVAWEHFKERMRFGQPDYEGAKKKVIELMRKHHVLGGTVSDTRMIVTNKGVHETVVDNIFNAIGFFSQTPVTSKVAIRDRIKGVLEKFRQFYALGDEWIKPIIFMNNYDVFMAREKVLHPELSPEQREDAAARAAAEQTLRETTAWELTSRMARELSANRLRFLTPDFIMHNFQMLRILAANYYRWWEALGEFTSLDETVAEIQRSGREVGPRELQLYRDQLKDELVRRGVGGLATFSTYAAIATTGMGIVPIAVNAVLSALYGTKDDDDEEKEPGKRTGKGIGYGAFTPEEWDGAVRVTNWLTGGSNLYAPIFREDKWTMYGWNYARSNAMLTHIIPHIPNENWKPQDIPATFLRNLMDLQNGTMTQELVNYFLGKDRFGREIGVWEGFNKIMERSFTPGVVRQILGVTTGYEMSDTIFHSGKAIKIPELGGITLNKYDLRDVTNMLAYFIRDRQDSDKNYHRRNFLEAINKPSRIRDAELYAIIREFRENNRYEIGKADYLLNGLKQMGLSDSDIAHHLSIGRKSGNTIISREKAMAYVRGENILDTTFYDYLRRKRKSLIKDAKNLRMSRDELMVVLDNYQRAIRIYRQNMQAER